MEWDQHLGQPGVAPGDVPDGLRRKSRSHLQWDLGDAPISLGRYPRVTIYQSHGCKRCYHTNMALTCYTVFQKVTLDGPQKHNAVAVEDPTLLMVSINVWDTVTNGIRGSTRTLWLLPG